MQCIALLNDVSEVKAQMIIQLLFDSNIYRNRNLHTSQPTNGHVLHQVEEYEWTHLSERSVVCLLYLQHPKMKEIAWKTPGEMDGNENRAGSYILKLTDIFTKNSQILDIL